MPFQKISNESNRKPNKTWVDKGSEFYNKKINKIMTRKKRYRNAFKI